MTIDPTRHGQMIAELIEVGLATRVNASVHISDPIATCVVRRASSAVLELFKRLAASQAIHRVCLQHAERVAHEMSIEVANDIRGLIHQGATAPGAFGDAK